MKNIILIISLILFASALEGQIHHSSPANWLYPDGNPEATRLISKRSNPQAADSFVVKWSTPAICGQIQPLIGNIINNPKLNENYEYAPLEITAVVGNRIVVVDAKGKVHKKTTQIQNLKSVSALFDTTSNQLYNITAPVVLGLETTETENEQYKLIYGYLAGYIDKIGGQAVDTVAKLLSLSIDLRPFEPNYFGSIKPFFFRNQNNEKITYSTINMTSPYIDPYYSPLDPVPFFRGFSTFNANENLAIYPLPDVADSEHLRRYLGPEINVAQPSISRVNDNTLILFPNYPSEELDCFIYDDVYYSSSNEAYLLMANIDSPDDIATNFNNTLNIDKNFNKRPFIRSHFVKLNDGYGENDFILLSESYKGYEGSFGKAKLHLFDSDGYPLSDVNDIDDPSFLGGDDHQWSVAVGNVDGTDPSNQFLPWYPNNPGNEIIVTQSTKELIYPSSMLYILRYKSNELIPKSSLPNEYLFPFDTIVSHRINGWVAAVNDIDGAPDGKDEIILADGSNLRILRLRDYDSKEFRFGHPFDTVYTAVFPYQTISAVAVADLEGDGLNDIIVTTFDSTYVIGMPSENSVKIVFPKVEEDPPAEYCNGDTLKILWTNVLLSAQKVNLSFQEYRNDAAFGERVLLQSGILNTQDTVLFKYVLDTLLLGKQGRFLIQSSERPERISDSTAILRISLPNLQYSFAPYSKVYTGDDLIIQGTSACVDSIGIEISRDSVSWTELAVAEVFSDGSFYYSTEMPCFNVFECFEPLDSNIAYLKILIWTAGVEKAIETIPVYLMPAKIDISYDTSQTADPSRLITWDLNKFQYPCDTISVAMSLDGGESYIILGRTAAATGSFVWNVPVEAPDSVIVCLCCENSCISHFEVMRHFQIKYLQIVAPNPFNPFREKVEFVYSIPNDANVTVRIYDQNNRIVAEPVRGEARLSNIAYCDRWDGTTWDGSFAPNGMYYISLELSSGYMEVYPLFIRK